MFRLASISRSSFLDGRSKVTNLSRNGNVNIHSRVRHLQTLSLQLDYYMSPQFAGIACAMTNQLYEKNGIELKFLPICPVGHELAMVRNNATKSGASEVTVGSVEQNIFIPTLHNDPKLRVKAIAAMFRRSPLCLTSLKTSASDRSIVGAHEDTVSLLERILKNSHKTNNTSVIASARSTKITDLTSGKVDRIQTYLTTEVPTLERALGADAIENQVLEGLNGAKLGYSQMLFAPEEDLEASDKRVILQSFLNATFEGWKIAIGDTESAAKSVEEAKVMLRLDDENNDHWESSFSYTKESVGLCNNFVKETFQGDRYGVIDVSRWNEATEWLLAGENVMDRHTEKNFGIDTDIWQPSSQLLAGNELARVTLENAKISAEKFATVYNRKPSLAVITLGDLPRYTDSDKRLKMYSNDENSWFNKKSVGEVNGFDVTDIVLPETTTTDELLSQLYALKSVDGIQLMWPLPNHIDSAKVYNAIDLSVDVDGAHYIGQSEVAPQSSPIPAVTPAAVMAILDKYNIDLKNKGVLVIGRSRIVGSPVAHMLRQQGAVVTVAHSEVAPEMLESLVRSADTIVSCAGSPGLLKAKWLKPGAEVINVGTTFISEEKGLVSDFDGDLAANAKRFSPVPGGIGPLSVAHLFQNVAEVAWNRATTTLDVEGKWTKKSGSLNRSFHFKDYNSALAFANEVNEMSTTIDHHANIIFSHKCVKGVDVDMEFFTYEANGITDKDYEAARGVNSIFESKQIQMSDFTYNLNLESIAKYPASPRGSSRLLRVDSDGNIAHYPNFSESFLSLADGAHIVFNESKVANGRVYVVKKNISKAFEMMILDIGDTVGKTCNGLHLNVMLREEGVKVGEEFTDEPSGTGKFRVVKVVGPWIEDEHSNGNGTECIVECIVVDKATTLTDLLERIGTVPIPPYLNREAVASDLSSYNNVYASGTGSVAAPTAGLHFNDDLLEKISYDNISFLSLHVGAGTFKPVVTEDARDHQMHSEHYAVNVGEIRRIINVLESNKRMIVVGTTSSRTLESIYWCGVKQLQKKNDSASESKLTLGQHEWQELNSAASTISAVDSLRAIISGKDDNETIIGKTSLMIVPNSYDFKVVDELVTNFHAPDSTLMLLVSAFLGSGEKVKSVYEDAQNMGYRFLSYGDVCYFSRPKK